MTVTQAPRTFGLGVCVCVECIGEYNMCVYDECQTDRTLILTVTTDLSPLWNVLNVCEKEEASAHLWSYTAHTHTHFHDSVFQEL